MKLEIYYSKVLERWIASLSSLIKHTYHHLIGYGDSKEEAMENLMKEISREIVRSEEYSDDLRIFLHNNSLGSNNQVPCSD